MDKWWRLSMCIKERNQFVSRLKISPFVVFLTLTALAAASDKIPLDPRSPQPASGEHLEVERIEIQKAGAIPATIHRRPGRFFLLVVNRNEANRDAAFVVDPASIGDMTLGPNPLLRLGGPGLNDYKHRSASIFVAPVGEFDLKYADTGKIVCHISIDSN